MKGDYLARYFQLTAGIVLVGVGFMTATSKWTFPPALQSVWFVPHVLAYMIGYTLTAVACIVMTVSFFKRGEVAQVGAEDFRKKDETATLKSEKELLREGCNSLARVAFPFMTVGMLFGAIWANQVWGHYWSWDIKENWALITWLISAIYLHFYKDKKLRKITPVFLLLSLAGILMTMVFINFFKGSGSMHMYS